MVDQHHDAKADVQSEGSRVISNLLVVDRQSAHEPGGDVQGNQQRKSSLADPKLTAS